MIIFGKEYKTLPSDIKYLCYSNIVPPYKGFEKDCSWGCCLRNLQSVLGNFIYRHHLPLDILEVGELSIHNILRVSEWYGGTVGSYYSQSSVCRALVDISQRFQDFSVLCIDTKSVASSTFIFPMLLLCPMRFGLDRIEERYINSIDTILHHKNSLGFIGGKATSSFYIIGTTHCDQLIYLDPHYFRASNLLAEFSLPKSSIRNQYTISDLDPSITFAFDISDDKEFDEIMDLLKVCENAMVSCVESSPVGYPIVFYDQDGFCIIDNDD